VVSTCGINDTDWIKCSVEVRRVIKRNGKVIRECESSGMSEQNSSAQVLKKCKKISGSTGWPRFTGKKMNNDGICMCVHMWLG